MKHLEKFDGYGERPKNIIPSDSDFDKINNEFINTIKENGIEPNTYAIYSDLELLKKDMENLTVKVTPEVFELLLEFVKSAEKSLKTEEIQQITFYK